ncbi:MAG: tRNA uridine-5-carboxymethylaminomethyl(34) synthesis GTPase MnmE [Desulfatiglans sp.]|jgi:tRNA modification GTPase|nr:tRNA uridine-5-carboxymethylaminomethyl(34) synthesis GTPase MnmE [Desulfatiglans sp.]
MSQLPENDTIAAIATPYGMAGIGIIRISGPLSLTVAERLFRSSKNRSIESHRLYHGHLIDPSSNEVIDEILLSYMKAPHTYTREDIVEINSHSGPVLLSRILQIILEQGVRLAKPGEFTFRAFLNNRIDLIQAEAVMDLINAKSERGIILSNRQLSGESGKEIRDLRDKALDLLAMAEVAIDYPEDESITKSNEAILSGLTEDIINPVEKIISSHSSRKIWIEGIDTVITGRVNTGKSSLLNRLIKEEKAIVSPIPGTTRDLIETTLYIKGIPFKITDTAGLREGKDAIELIGIDLARKRLKEADIALAVIDQSRPLDENDRELLAGMDINRCIIILNKVDLPKAVNEEEVRELAGESDIVKISALTGEGIDMLEESIVKKISETETGLENHLVPNIRQKSALSKALDHFKCAASNIMDGYPMEIIAVDLKSGIENLEEVTGETSRDDLYDRIFSRFCLGK